MFKECLQYYYLFVTIVCKNSSSVVQLIVIRLFDIQSSIHTVELVFALLAKNDF